MSRTSCVVNSPRAPRLDGELEDVALGPEELGDGASVERALIAGAGLAGVHASGFTLMRRASWTSISAARLGGLRL